MAQNKNTNPRALPFGIDNREMRANYGEYQVEIDLADGRTMHAYADRAEVHDGALQLIASREDKPDFATVTLAPGTWLSHHVVSAFDGSPVSIFSLRQYPPDEYY
ncbi:hypothetical protein [Rhodococcus opacus]|uniref:hypothetical protein n=1 Tax=Rhodococcus opacus TaxID=37919 RepID=UPI00223692FA|nr:hypothetical protein [Rhodococcus opacus]UZG58012.1 hypothetical protein ONE62_12200 [Rhodococcus opacus]